MTYGFDYNNFMQLESVSAGSDTLITNTYENGYGNLTQSQYENGDKVLYSYDSLDRVIDKWYYNTESGTYAQYEWAYDAANRVASFTDVPESKVYRYTYDLSGRLTEMNRNDGAYIRTAYDTKNLTTGLTYGFGGLTESTSFTYKETMDNAPENANFTDGSSSSIAYDSLGRKYRDYITSPSGRVLTSTYSYVDHATVANRTSGLVSKIDYNLSSLDDIEYEYDSRGNITLVTYGDLICDKYTYDSLNRLTRVDSELYDQTCVYTYDASGNIQTKTIYDCDNIYEALSEKDLVDTITYSYGSADWKDKLTAYDGNYIDYDEIGNPLSYNGKTFTWVGRRLDTYTSGSTTTSYTYNSDGIRTSKTVGSTKTEYFLNGSQILAQKTGSNVIPFYYDANGTRIAFKYNGTMYYYVYNLQGDVTHIIDANKNIVGTYQYDAWGRILNHNSLTSIAQINPFRYRGYYYDTESGLYYLNSRYYNAEWGRFINADGYITTGQGLTSYNMFVYCGNNPVNRADFMGNFWSELWTSFTQTVQQYSGYFLVAAGISQVDSPAFGPADIASIALLMGGTLVCGGVAIYTTLTSASQSLSIPDVEEKEAVIPAQPPSDSNVIYRYGGTNPGNLTPKAKDKYSGLSFSTIPMPGAAMTTIEELNSTGVVYAVKDGVNHVSVRPVNATVDDWINAGSASIWTQAVKSVVIKWDMGY